MRFEIALVAFGFLTLMYLFVDLAYTYRFFGLAYGWSSNRTSNKVLPPIGQRIKNTFQNQVESATYIVPVFAAAAITGLEHQGAELAAVIVIGARALFGPLYYTGLPFARVPAWAVGWVATAYISVIVLMNA